MPEPEQSVDRVAERRYMRGVVDEAGEHNSDLVNAAFMMWFQSGQ